MNDHSYLREAKEALDQVRAAISAAAAMLPEEVRREHWVRQKMGDPSPWRGVERWHLQHLNEQYGKVARSFAPPPSNEVKGLE